MNTIDTPSSLSPQQMDVPAPPCPKVKRVVSLPIRSGCYGVAADDRRVEAGHITRGRDAARRRDVGGDDLPPVELLGEDDVVRQDVGIGVDLRDTLELLHRRADERVC